MRNSKYISVIGLAAMLLAVGCGKIQEQETDDIPRDGIVLKLLPGGVEAEVKSVPNEDETRPGNWDGSYNENYLGTEVDVFFFDSDAVIDDSSIYSGRFSVNASGYVQIPASKDKLATIFGGDYMHASAKVVVVANYNGTPINHEQSYSLRSLMNMSVATASWNTFPQTSFVMISCDRLHEDSPLYPIEITRPGTVSPASATIPMKRLAAKVTFRITIADEITVVNVTRDAEGNIIDRSLETWRPQMSAVTAYLQYAIKTATLSCQPQSPPATVPLSNIPADHPSVMAYDQRNMYQTTDVISRTRTPVESLTTDDPPEIVYGTPVTSDFPVYEVKKSGPEALPGPFYTYPVKWDQGAAGEPFIKLIIPWQSGGRVKYYYYKVPFKESPIESNHWYVITLDVEILGGEDQAPVPLEASYQVASWERGTIVDINSTITNPRYLNASTTEYIMYNMEQLTIPITSSHDVQIVGFEVKPGASNQNDRASGKAFVSGDKALTDSWIGKNPRIYNPFTDTLDDDGVTSETVVGPVNITTPDYSYSTWSTGNPYPETADAASCFAVADITRDHIIFRHSLNNNMDSEDGSGNANYDVAPYYIRFRIRHKDDYSFYKDFLIEQRPGIIIEPQLNTDGTNDANHGYVIINKINNPNSSDDWTKNSTLSGQNSNPNMYVITTGVLSSDTDIIGDPRETSKHNSGAVVSGWTSATAALINGEEPNHTLTNYYPTRSDGSAQNIIAPSFRVASSYGKSTYMSKDDAKRRCASYQEDGYPAGRWRIPTKAEVLFITTLSADKMIPELFTFDASLERDPSYWCASGVIDGKKGVPTYYTDSGKGSGSNDMEGKRYIRCVYDEWFWEDTQYERLATSAISTFTWGDLLRNSVVKIED